MFDLGWPELLLIGIVGLIVIGPKDLPRAVKTVSSYLSQARRMMRDLQSGVDEMVREAELDDIRKQVKGVADGSLKDEFEHTIDPDGRLRAVRKELDDSFKGDPLADGPPSKIADEVAADTPDPAPETAPEPAKSSSAG